MCNTSLFDRAMFTLVWKPLISSIAFAFTTFDDDYVIQRAIAGFRQCATLAGNFQLPDVFDYIVQSLSHVTTLLSDSGYTTVPNHPVVEVEGRGISVSSLSVKFGNNIRAQLAAVVLFTIANGNGNAIREGWIQVKALMFGWSKQTEWPIPRFSRCLRHCFSIRCYPSVCSKWRISWVACP